MANQLKRGLNNILVETGLKPVSTLCVLCFSAVNYPSQYWLRIKTPLPISLKSRQDFCLW